MYRNQYDTDVTTFSPAGRIHQVEYATEAVKQGSCVVALRSDEIAVVACLKRAENDFASYQPKIFQIDEKMGIGVSGLISDARVVSKYLRSESLNNSYVFGGPGQVERLICKFSDKSQIYTQKSEKRPFGLGLLAVGYDKTGPHVFQTEPSGVYFECFAMAIGARSQSARTYLEKSFESFPSASKEELIRHSLHALKGASQKKLTSRNVTVGVVGKDLPFTILEGEAVRAFVGAVTNEDDLDEEEKKPRDDEEDEKEEKERQNQEEEKEAQSVAQEQAREEGQALE